MGLNLYLKPGSGRATCQLCNKLIQAGDLDLHFEKKAGVQTISGHYHKSCVDKMEVKQDA